MEGPDEPEAERLPPELLLRIADFLKASPRALYKLAICSKGTFNLLAPRLATSVALKDLLRLPRVENSAKSHALSRIEELSLEQPDFGPASEAMLDNSRETITSLSVTAKSVWQLDKQVRDAKSLPNLCRLTINLPEPVGMFPGVPVSDMIVSLPVNGSKITELTMMGYHNSAILNRLVEIFPAIKEINLCLGSDCYVADYDNAATWAFWDGTDLSDRAVSLLRNFDAPTWRDLLDLCERPTFRPRLVDVHDLYEDEEQDAQERTWLLLGLMPDLEVFSLDSLPSNGLRFGLPGTKSFSVSNLSMRLESAHFEEVFEQIRRAPHDSIHLGFWLDDQIESGVVDADGDAERREFIRRRRAEVDFWKRVGAELGEKVSLDFGINDEEAFWAKWDT